MLWKSVTPKPRGVFYIDFLLYKSIDDAMEDDNRVKAMQEELDQFQKTMFGSL